MRLEFISLNEFHWLIYIERQFGLVFKVFRFKFLSVGEFESGFEFFRTPQCKSMGVFPSFDRHL